MGNRLVLYGRVRLILYLLAFCLFAISAGPASTIKSLTNTLYMQPSFVLTTSLKSAMYMQPYSTTLQSSFGIPPYTYALASGTLPPGIALNHSGNITGTPTRSGRWTFLIRTTDSSPVHAQRSVRYALSVSMGLDIYGGLTALSSPGGRTGYFRVEKDANDRWMFVSPLGNYFWMYASYNETSTFLQTTPINVLTVKYGGNKTNWAMNQNNRLLKWGFNTIGEYATTYVLPVNTNRFHNNANPVKLPFIALINAMPTMFVHPTLIGLPEAPKSLIKGVPSNITVWRGSNMADMYDPKVKTGYQNQVAYT